MRNEAIPTEKYCIKEELLAPKIPFLACSFADAETDCRLNIERITEVIHT